MMALILKMLKTVKVLSNMTSSLHTIFMKPVQMLLVFAALLLLCVGCYRMPTDDDCSLVPTTNNPDVTRDRGSSLVPGGNF